ncbi:MAG: hypothetical protein AAFQ37_01900 [Bacteroidota bacterium]
MSTTQPSTLENVDVFTAVMPSVKRAYTIKLSGTEVHFLGAFIQWMIDNFNDPEYLLELCTIYEFGRRYRLAFQEIKDRQFKLQSNEMIALKRMLWLPSLPTNMNVHRNNILGKIDQLTTGVH